MLAMAEKEKRGRGRPAKGQKSKDAMPQLHTTVDTELREAIESCRRASEFPPSLNDMGVKAWQEFLEKRGFWPPSRG